MHSVVFPSGKVKLAIDCDLLSFFFLFFKQRSSNLFRFGEPLFNLDLFNQVMAVICFPLSSCHLHFNSSLPAAVSQISPDCRRQDTTATLDANGACLQGPHEDPRSPAREHIVLLSGGEHGGFGELSFWTHAGVKISAQTSRCVRCPE